VDDVAGGAAAAAAVAGFPVANGSLDADGIAGERS